VGAELIGWISSAVLLVTLGRQVYSQWKSERAVGVSRWLFIGQLAASVGFAIYSWLLNNWVFLVTNIALLLTAILGEIIYLRNRRKERRKTAHDEAERTGEVTGRGRTAATSVR
jgi:MtN3 and saliva related transmembrane protein